MSEEYYDKEDKKLMKRMADNLEQYIDAVDRYCIIEDLPKEDYDEAMKDARKLIKHLKDGKGEKVFNWERYQEAKRSGRLTQ